MGRCVLRQSTPRSNVIRISVLLCLLLALPARATDRSGGIWGCLPSFSKLAQVLGRTPPAPHDASPQVQVPQMSVVPFVRLFTRFVNDPLSIIDRSLKEGGVRRVRIPGMKDILIIGNYDLAKQILGQTDRKLPVLRDSQVTKGGARQYGKENPFIGDPQIHDRARGYVQKAFTPDSVYRDAVVADLGAAADKLVAAIGRRNDAKPGIPFDVTQDVNEATMHALLRGVLGYEPADGEIRNDIWPSFAHVNSWILTDTLLAKLHINVNKLPAITPSQRRLRQSHQTINRLVDKIIENARRPDAKDDFLFYHVARDPSVPDEYLRSTIKTTLAGGIETSSSYINWTMLALSQHPEVAKELRQEIDSVVGKGPLQADHIRNLPKLSAFVREVGRQYSPFYFVPRSATEDFTLDSAKYGPIPVRKGTHLLVSIYHSNHDSAVWKPSPAGPDGFDPFRFRPPNDPTEPRQPTPLTFGHGKYVCLGVHLAEAEAMTFAVELLRNYELKDSGRPNLGIRSDLSTHPKGGNWMGFAPVSGEVGK